MEHEPDIYVDPARRGDRDAFRKLVEAHSHSVFRVAFRVLGDEANAEDAVQETFLRAYQSLSSFDGRARFSTWLHRIAVNQAIDLQRRSLAALSELERTAFLLRHVEGCSIAEIGAALDLGTSATKQAIFRAVKKLRQALEPWVRIRHEAVS